MTATQTKAGAATPGTKVMTLLEAITDPSKAISEQYAAFMLTTESGETVVGQIRFGKDGEWAKPRMVVTQWQNVTGNDLGQVTDLKKWVVVWPPEHKTGNLIYPFESARK